MAAVDALLPKYRAALEYVAGIYKIMAEDFATRASGQPPVYKTGELITSAKIDLPKVSNDLYEIYLQLERQDVKKYERDKSGDAAYLASLVPGIFVSLRKDLDEDIKNQLLGIIVKQVYRGRSILVEYVDPKGEYENRLGGMALIWDADRGKWRSTLNMRRWINSEVDVDDPLYVLDASADPHWKDYKIEIVNPSAVGKGDEEYALPVSATTGPLVSTNVSQGTSRFNYGDKMHTKGVWPLRISVFRGENTGNLFAGESHVGRFQIGSSTPDIRGEYDLIFTRVSPV